VGRANDQDSRHFQWWRRQQLRRTHAGAEIVCGIDLCEVATATYKENFPEASTITKALENINPRKLHDSIGDVDLLLASPECTKPYLCQGFRAEVGTEPRHGHAGPALCQGVQTALADP